MTGLNASAAPQPHAWISRRAAQLTHQASMRENVFEHMLLGQLGAELLARGIEYEELHSSVDKDGYDVLLEAGGIQRHIQLKVTIKGGKRSNVDIHTRLATRPSGCVVWLTYDPVERGFCDIRWFGAAPGEPLPNLGDKVVRHTRANKEGKKADRPHLRVVPAGRFSRLVNVAHLVDRLFGKLPADPVDFLRSRLLPDVTGGPAWLAAVAQGHFAAIPHDLEWDDGTALAGLIDGYRLLDLLDEDTPESFLDRQRTQQQSTGTWHGDAALLWTTLFLEARADHFGANDLSEVTPNLDLLCRQLRGALIELETYHA